jgi:hypothetical protein
MNNMEVHECVYSLSLLRESRCRNKDDLDVGVSCAEKCYDSLANHRPPMSTT